MVERTIVVLALLAGLTVAAPAQAAPLDTSPTLEVSVVGNPLVGERTFFEWHVTDPDPFTVVTEFRIDYGDGRVSGPVTGFGLLCGEALNADGLDETFRTAHTYESVGGYVVRARVRVRAQICGGGITDAQEALDTAEVRVSD